MQIIISGRGVDLTDAVESYVQKKLNNLEKFLSNIIRANVALGKETRHHNKGEVFFAECRLEVPGNDLFARENAADLYTAIDFLQATLDREIKKYKVKVRGNIKKKKSIGRKNKEYSAQADY